jgi:hypothetical protein
MIFQYTIGTYSQVLVSNQAMVASRLRPLMHLDHACAWLRNKFCNHSNKHPHPHTRLCTLQRGRTLETTPPPPWASTAALVQAPPAPAQTLAPPPLDVLLLHAPTTTANNTTIATTTRLVDRSLQVLLQHPMSPALAPGRGPTCSPPPAPPAPPPPSAPPSPAREWLVDQP